MAMSNHRTSVALYDRHVALLGMMRKHKGWNQSYTVRIALDVLAERAGILLDYSIEVPSESVVGNSIPA